MKWKNKRAVTVLSTIHNPIEPQLIRKREKTCSLTELNCPKAIAEYRRFMGGVDRADMLKSYYGIHRKSRKWWHRLF